jgi:hypothetical protein
MVDGSPKNMAGTNPTPSDVSDVANRRMFWSRSFEENPQVFDFYKEKMVGDVGLEPTTR